MGFSKEESKLRIYRLLLFVKRTLTGCSSNFYVISFCLQDNRHYTNKTKGDTDSVLVMSKALILPNITMEDKGMYRCRGEIEPMRSKNASAKVLVFGEFVLDKP